MSLLIEVSEPPRDGTNYIKTWTYNGEVWSGTCKYVNGEEYIYIDSTSGGSGDFSLRRLSKSCHSIRYFIYKGGIR